MRQGDQVWHRSRDQTEPAAARWRGRRARRQPLCCRPEGKKCFTGKEYHGLQISVPWRGLRHEECRWLKGAGGRPRRAGRPSSGCAGEPARGRTPATNVEWRLCDQKCEQGGRQQQQGRLGPRAKRSCCCWEWECRVVVCACMRAWDCGGRAQSWLEHTVVACCQVQNSTGSQGKDRLGAAFKGLKVRSRVPPGHRPETETRVEKVRAPAHVFITEGPEAELPWGSSQHAASRQCGGALPLGQHLRGVDLLLYQALRNLHGLRAKGQQRARAGGQGDEAA